MSTDTAVEEYFRVILAREFMDPNATIELIPDSDGVFCGVREVAQLVRELRGHGFQIWALDEGEMLTGGEVALRLRGHFLEYGMHINRISGILATASGWATAAYALVQQADPLPVIVASSRLLLPNAEKQFERAAQVGGCIPSDSVLRRGTLSRELVLLMGDTLRALRAFDQVAPTEVPRLAFVDTYHDAADEAVRIALGLGDHLAGVIVQAERSRESGTVADLKKIRAQLDLAGFPRVKIYVYGYVTPDQIAVWKNDHEPLDGLFVGDTIAAATPIPFSAELKESDGKPLARRGLVPGTTPSPRLKRLDLA